MAVTRIIAGVVDGNGNIISGGDDFQVNRPNTGEYQINFYNGFSEIPAVVGSQVLYGSDQQSSADNIVFPFVSRLAFTALTGNGQGTHDNRSFAFIAAGN
ncbi:hypothetical protein ACRQ1B_01290 [Rhizobium panacihumi]|uniref:hypothetical protein n=1 Tax=Rhizobium panacihumi TaxID=2008450 RepID=UPI003D7A433E